MHEYLAYLGLHPKAASVYLEGLTHGPLPAARLAECINIKRVSVYGLLDSLVRAGLAERSISGKRTVFVMKPPDTIKTLVLEKQKQTARLLANLPKEIKKLTFAPPHDTQTNIHVVKGLHEVTQQIQELAKQKSSILWMGNLHALTRFIPEKQLFLLFSAKRMRHPTSTKAITDSSIDKLSLFRETVGSYRQFRFLPMNTSAIIALWDDTMGIFTASRTPTLILIRDGHTSVLFKAAFNALWETLPKP